MVTAKQIILYINTLPQAPYKIYLGTAEENFKKRYYTHKKSFKNIKKANGTTFLKYVWEVQDKYKETSS